MTEHHDSVNAAVGFIVTVVGWILSMAVQALPVIQALSGLVACVTGVFAIRYYYKAAKNK